MSQFRRDEFHESSLTSRRSFGLAERDLDGVQLGDVMAVGRLSSGGEEATPAEGSGPTTHGNFMVSAA